jgi:hypothetical protein
MASLPESVKSCTRGQRVVGSSERKSKVRGADVLSVVSIAKLLSTVVSRMRL